VFSPCRGLGALRTRRGRGTAGIGLPGSTPSPTRKVKNWFQADQHRLIDALAWLEEKSPNASRTVWADIWSAVTAAGSTPAAAAKAAVIAARSRRYAAVVCGLSLRERRAAKNRSMSVTTDWSPLAMAS